MRKIIFQIMTSLDGFIEGADRELDWHVVDEEYHEFAEEVLRSVDAILFGRVTYQHMADYWPTPFAIENNPSIAEKMNNLPKFVFSKTLNKAEWHNTKLIKGDTLEEIAKLKQQPGRDIVLLGSSSFASALAELSLIDEYVIIVNPVVLGRGTPLLKDKKKKLELKLLKTKVLRSGNVILYYKPNSSG